MQENKCFMDFADIINFGIVAFALSDPFGALPLFIIYTREATPAAQRLLAIFTGTACFLLLILFLFLGQQILAIFGISIAAFRIAGGLVLLRASFDMMSHSDEEDTGSAFLKSDQESNTPMDEAKTMFSRLVIPVVVPTIVGPGMISLVIVYGNRAPNIGVDIELGIILAIVSAMITLILIVGDRLQRFIGEMGMKIFLQIIGLIIAAVAIQFIIVGLADITINFIDPTALGVHLID